MLAEIDPLPCGGKGGVGVGLLGLSVHTTAAVFLVNKKHAMTSIWQ